MHLRSLFRHPLTVVVALAAAVAVARADVQLDARALEPDPAAKGAAPVLQVTVIGASPQEATAYTLKQANKTVVLKATKVLPFLEGPDPIGLVLVVLADGNYLTNQGKTDIQDSVQAAFATLAAGGPRGSQVSVVTYAEAATVVQSAGPLAELSNLKLTPGPTGPKAARALAAGLKAGIAELDKLAPTRKVLVLIGDGIDGDGATAASTAIRDVGRQLTERKILTVAMIYQLRGAEFGQPESPLKLDPVTKLMVPDDDAGAELERAWRQTRKQALEDAKFFTADHATELSSKTGFTVAADSLVGELADRFYVQFPGYDKAAKAGLTWDGKPHALTLRVDGNDLATVEAVLEPKWSPPGGGSAWWIFVLIPVGLIAVGAVVAKVVRKPKAAAAGAGAAAGPGGPVPGTPGGPPGPGGPGAPGGAGPAPAPGKPMKTQFINLAGDDVFPIVGWLVFLNGPQKFKTHKLSSGITKIGTGKESDIVIDDGYMSTNHALVITTPDGFTLQDNSSTNGTFVNNARIPKHELNDGDVVMVGRTQLKFKATI